MLETVEDHRCRLSPGRSRPDDQQATITEANVIQHEIAGSTSLT
jgi:hypothetical protein